MRERKGKIWFESVVKSCKKSHPCARWQDCFIIDNQSESRWWIIMQLQFGSMDWSGLDRLDIFACTLIKMAFKPSARSLLHPTQPNPAHLNSISIIPVSSISRQNGFLSLFDINHQKIWPGLALIVFTLNAHDMASSQLIWNYWYKNLLSHFLDSDRSRG